MRVFAPAYVLAVVLIEVGDVLYDLLVAEILEGLLSRETERLPEDDGERPHVAFCAELVLKEEVSVGVDVVSTRSKSNAGGRRQTYQQDALPGHPADRQEAVAVHLVVVLPVDLPVATYVRYFDVEAPSYEAVPEMGRF